MIRKTFVVLLGLLILSLVQPSFSAIAAPPKAFPSVIPLPNGFQPEGITIGRGTQFFVGSLLNGAIYQGDLRSSEGEILVPPQEGRWAVGLAFDRRSNFLFVAGGPTGAGYVYDAATGDTVAVYQLTTESFPATLVNDVVVTDAAAFFTDSFRPFLYRLPLGPGGALAAQVQVEEITLGDDFNFVPESINANGIDATPDGKSLVIVNTELGELYRVDPDTGNATPIALGGMEVPAGDGLLLNGRTIYVVQNVLNQIAVIRLNRELTSGVVLKTITDPNFRIPTTIDKFGRALYAVNARFDVAPPPLPGSPPADPDTEFEVVRVFKHPF